LARLRGSATDYRAVPAAIRPDVKRWIGGLQEAGVKKAFVSVQCENCHGGLPDHPFGNEAREAHAVDSQRCLLCHTKEQMPTWYDDAGVLKPEALAEALKGVRCPAGK
jgi:hypothetical protein